MPVSSATFCIAKHCKILCKGSKSKSCGMLTYGVVLHDSACQHASTAACTWVLLERFNWELSDHRPYSPGLVPRDYHLFICLKSWLRSQHFNNIEELMEGVKMWLNSQAADFCDADVQKIIPRYNKCLFFFLLFVLLSAHQRLHPEFILLHTNSLRRTYRVHTQPEYNK
jgi:hypothetical protein